MMTPLQGNQIPASTRALEEPTPSSVQEQQPQVAPAAEERVGFQEGGLAERSSLGEHRPVLQRRALTPSASPCSDKQVEPGVVPGLVSELVTGEWNSKQRDGKRTRPGDTGWGSVPPGRTFH